jgi:hypothetical protein
MSETIYTLCAVTSILCALLLFRGWLQTRAKLLFWSALCFAGLAGTNFMLVLDELVYTNVDMILPRLWISLGAVLLMLYGLIIADE